MSSSSSQLGDAAENSGIDNALAGIATVRAATLMREFARVAEVGEWKPGAAEKFMSDDRAQFIMDTNQGRFVLTIERG